MSKDQNCLLGEQLKNKEADLKKCEEEMANCQSIIAEMNLQMQKVNNTYQRTLGAIEAIKSILETEGD